LPGFDLTTSNMDFADIRVAFEQVGREAVAQRRSPVMMRLRLQMLMPVSARCSWNQADVVKRGRVR
jgi:hypothetical protein